MIGCITLILLLLVATVHCQVFIDVQSNCGTACDGTSSSPFATLLEGLQRIQSGGSLAVRDGIYKGAGNKNLNISSQNTAITSVNGPGSTIIDCENDGFGFDLFSGTFSITGFTIRNCYRNIEATYQDNSYGGGAFSIHSTFTTLTNMNLVDNDAKGLGGAVYIYSNTVFMYNTTIESNDVTGVGGGVYVQSAYLKLDNGTQIINNKASINASDLFCTSATVELIDQNSKVDNIQCPNCAVTRDHKSLCSGAPITSASSLFALVLMCLYVLM